MTLHKTAGKPIRTYNELGHWRDWSTDELVGAKLNHLLGWKCGAGVDSLFIDMDGYVWTASCRVGGKLGSVWNTFNVPNTWIDCTQNVCSCGADLFIPKATNEKTIFLLRQSAELPTQMDKNDPTLTEFVALERTHVSSQKQIYWEIGRRCNYDCSYCWPWIHNNTDPHKPLADLIKATNLLEEKFIKGESVNFIISGGEPTTNKDFIDWLRYLNAFGHHISLHSNGSRKPDYYRELIHFGDLNLSVHFEFYDRPKFVKVVEAIASEKSKHGNRNVGHLEVKFMMPPQFVDEALSLEEELKSIAHFTELCTWAFVPIRGSMQNKFATPDQSKITKNWEEIMEGYAPEHFVLFGDRK